MMFVVPLRVPLRWRLLELSSGYASTRNYVFYEMSGSLSTRFTLKQRFKWGKISTSTLKNAISSHLFTLYVILQREYTHSFRSKQSIWVGLRPLVLPKFLALSGYRPTLLRWNECFEWISIYSSSLKCWFQVDISPFVLAIINLPSRCQIPLHLVKTQSLR